MKIFVTTDKHRWTQIMAVIPNEVRNFFNLKKILRCAQDDILNPCLSVFICGFILLAAAPAYAAGYEFAPTDCEFRAVFPGSPFQSTRCNPDNPKNCKDTTSYTKVFDMNATVNLNITCNKAEENMYERYSGEVMQMTLTAMAETNGIRDIQAGFKQEPFAKQAVLIGTGKTGNTEKLYTAQLWIGKKSVMTIEAEIIGGSNQQADDMFAEFLRSIRHESVEPSKPAPEEKAGEAPAAEKTEPTVMEQ